MKKTISILLACVMVLASFAMVSAADSTLSTYEFGQPEKLTQPIKATTLLNSVCSVEDGNPIICTAASGDPGKFNVFDLEKGELLRSFDVPVGRAFWHYAADSKGNVYFAGFVGVNLYMYSPETKELTDLGKCSTETAICELVVDEQDNVFMATYPNAKILKWDAKAQKMMDLGNQLPGENYIRSLAYHDGYLYGGGAVVGTKFFKIDAKTMKKTFIPGPKLSSTLKSYYSATVVGGKKIFIWCETENSGSEYAIYDIEKGKFDDQIIPNAHGMYTSPEINGYCYISTKDGVLKYDLATEKIEPLGWNFGTGFRGNSVVQLKNNPDFPNKTMAIVTYGGDIAMIDFETGKREILKNKLDAVGTTLVGVKALENGQVVYSGHMGPRASGLNPETLEETFTFSMGQSSDIEEIDGKIYFATYPSSALWEYDPSKEIKTNENPKELYETASQGQSRPMKIVDCGDKIAISTIADYGKTEGAVVLYDKKTGKVDCYKNIIKNQSISGLTYKDGILYGSSTIFGGLGTDASKLEPSAKIFKMDVATGKLLTEVVPQFKDAKGVMKMAGDLAFGPDGLLWAVSDGLVFAMDPETLEVKKEKDVKGYDWNRYSSRWDPYGMEFDENGMLYCTPRNQLVVLDPETLETKDLPETGKDISHFSIGKDGYLYYFKLDYAYRMKIPSGNAADNNVVLMLNSQKTLVKGTDTALDVPATTVNDRTVVPVRFISESFGAKVDWSEEEQKVTITKDSTTITIVLGESKMVKNGTEIALDTAAFTQNDRTLLPLRAVAEALDKQVFWKELANNSGLIVIGDTMLDETKDKDKIDEYISKLQ